VQWLETQPDAEHLNYPETVYKRWSGITQSGSELTGVRLKNEQLRHRLLSVRDREPCYLPPSGSPLRERRCSYPRLRSSPLTVLSKPRLVRNYITATTRSDLYG